MQIMRETMNDSQTDRETEDNETATVFSEHRKRALMDDLNYGP